ncbi:MAG TPA: DNA polymerase I, partial [candidate division Zixibacteria bacterium]|nr:DNA polymerase I [candidate division Zixibacteria bacterium]
EDAEIALRLTNKLEEELTELGLYELFTTIEVPLIRVLAEMQISGVRLDIPFMKELSEKLKRDLNKLEGEIYESAGEEFNIGSPKQLSEILFEKLKLPVQKKTKTGYSTDAEVLQTLSAMHPLPKMIVDYRELAKLINTYLDALPQLVNSSTGRIHPTFQQAVTSTGRLSCKDPNLQNIPVRGEMGREIRKAFMPAKGNVLISADYSQIELRMMAHISGDESLIQAFRDGRDIHADTASRIFGVDIEDVTSEQRRMAKVINFGVIYGMTPWGVAGRLGIEFGEARKFVNAYFERYPGIADYMEKAPKDAEEKGFVETILGRRRYFGDIKNSKGMKAFLKRAAINTPIQGSAADLIKIAMLRIFERFEKDGLASKMILTVHDELVFDVPKDEIEMVKRITEEIMVSAMELAVPLTVDIGVGEDWLSAHE